MSEGVEAVFHVDGDTGLATARKGRVRMLRVISWVNILKDCYSKMNDVSRRDEECYSEGLWSNVRIVVELMVWIREAWGYFYIQNLH